MKPAVMVGVLEVGVLFGRLTDCKSLLLEDRPKTLNSSLLLES
jgi:hypothetical protein